MYVVEDGQFYTCVCACTYMDIHMHVHRCMCTKMCTQTKQAAIMPLWVDDLHHCFSMYLQR